MRNITAIALALLITACQTGPDQYRPITANPTPYEQASAICNNKAKAASAGTTPHSTDPMQGTINSLKAERYTRRACMAEHGYGLANGEQSKAGPVTQ